MNYSVYKMFNGNCSSDSLCAAFLMQISLPLGQRLTGFGTKTFAYSRDEIRSFENDGTLVAKIIKNELTGNMRKELEQYSDRLFPNKIKKIKHKEICLKFLEQLSLPLGQRISGLDTNSFAYSREELENFNASPRLVAETIRGKLAEEAFNNLVDAVENPRGRPRQQESMSLRALKEEIANNIFL